MKVKESFNLNAANEITLLIVTLLVSSTTACIGEFGLSIVSWIIYLVYVAIHNEFYYYNKDIINIKKEYGNKDKI